MKAYISELLDQAIQNISPDEAEAVLGSGVFDVTYPKSGFGDYATNVAMVLFKKFKTAPAGSPIEFASNLAESLTKLDKGNSFSKIESVNGFINFTLSQKFLLNRLSNVLEQAGDYGKSKLGENRTVIVEYFQNNIAKPPHVGHLRSAVIGDSLVRILQFVGYKTVTDTHIGDWGVQFGILLRAYKDFIAAGGSKAQIEANPVVELNKLYVEYSGKIDHSPQLRDLGKAEFQKLETGDAENRELWEWFVKVSLDDFERYRNLLGILPFDYNLGESFYEKQMAGVLTIFEEKKLTSVGDTGEIYVDLEPYGLGRCILVKSDGATTYHLRDFATYIYRKNEFNFYRNLYIVDVRQSHHFRQLFKVLELAGFPAETDSIHLEFGFMSLPEGAISTRKGNTISLENLIAEAEKRAREIIEEKNPSLQNKEVVVKQVALSAIKYFDLSHNRSTEIVFNWDQALSFEGNTGPYLQYTHARIHGIFRKASEDGIDVSIQNIDDSVELEQSELAVLRKLQQFPEIIELVANQYVPNLLTNYLFELAQSFNSFYQDSPILKEADLQKRSLRLSLIKATSQVLENGLNLLGITAPTEM